MGRRVARAVACAVALLLAGTAAAGAHGGEVVISEVKGPYGLRVQASPVVVDGEALVDLTAYPVRQDLGSPDSAATVTITIKNSAGAEKTLPAILRGDGYEVRVPGDRTAWRTWRIEARVRGAAGTVTFVARPSAADAGPPPAVIAISGVVAVLLIAGAVLVRRRRATA